MNPRPGGSKNHVFAQIARKGLLVVVSFVTHSSMKRGPLRLAVPEFPKPADEAV
ncbi:hypothetical protein [Streptomyces sp. NPDC086838]|uniref:hypothetical protein n=1 Tax=Streptomyces sp. NPDC086838 TaxID=3365762 RepID=UPI0038103AA4